MARYRALGPLFVRTLIAPGEEFESDLPPGRNWHPLDDEAQAAVEKFRAEKGAVLSIADRLDPSRQAAASVEIPADWDSLPWFELRALALKLGAQSNVKKDDAKSYVKAELERRGQKVA